MMFPVADSFGMKFRNILNDFDSEDVHRVLLVVFFVQFVSTRFYHNQMLQDHSSSIDDC